MIQPRRGFAQRDHASGSGLAQGIRLGGLAMSGPKRRELLGTSSIAVLSIPARSVAASISGELPWTPGHADPPEPVQAGAWQYFTAAESAAVEALVDRLIPPDPETPGGKDIGCA